MYTILDGKVLRLARAQDGWRRSSTAYVRPMAEREWAELCEASYGIHAGRSR